MPSEGYNDVSTEQTLQVGDTQIFGTKVVNETRFQYLREQSTQTPQSTAPTIIVPLAFNGGGYSGGLINGHDQSIMNFRTTLRYSSPSIF